MRPLPGPVAHALVQGAPCHGRLVFSSKNMYLGIREIWQTACVIKIEMSNDNMSNVLRQETETGDLMHGTLIRVQTGMDNRYKTASQLPIRISDIF